MSVPSPNNTLDQTLVPQLVSAITGGGYVAPHQMIQAHPELNTLPDEVQFKLLKTAVTKNQLETVQALLKMERFRLNAARNENELLKIASSLSNIPMLMELLNIKTVQEHLLTHHQVFFEKNPEVAQILFAQQDSKDKGEPKTKDHEKRERIQLFLIHIVVFADFLNYPLINVPSGLLNYLETRYTDIEVLAKEYPQPQKYGYTPFTHLFYHHTDKDLFRNKPKERRDYQPGDVGFLDITSFLMVAISLHDPDRELKALERQWAGGHFPDELAGAWVDRRKVPTLKNEALAEAVSQGYFSLVIDLLKIPEIMNNAEVAFLALIKVNSLEFYYQHQLILVELLMKPEVVKQITPQTWDKMIDLFKTIVKSGHLLAFNELLKFKPLQQAIDKLDPKEIPDILSNIKPFHLRDVGKDQHVILEKLLDFPVFQRHIADEHNAIILSAALMEQWWMVLVLLKCEKVRENLQARRHATLLTAMRHNQIGIYDLIQGLTPDFDPTPGFGENQLIPSFWDEFNQSVERLNQGGDPKLTPVTTCITQVVKTVYDLMRDEKAPREKRLLGLLNGAQFQSRAAATANNLLLCFAADRGETRLVARLYDIKEVVDDSKNRQELQTAVVKESKGQLATVRTILSFCASSNRKQEGNGDAENVVNGAASGADRKEQEESIPIEERSLAPNRLQCLEALPLAASCGHWPVAMMLLHHLQEFCPSKAMICRFFEKDHHQFLKMIAARGHLPIACALVRYYQTAPAVRIPPSIGFQIGDADHPCELPLETLPQALEGVAHTMLDRITQIVRSSGWTAYLNQLTLEFAGLTQDFNFDRETRQLIFSPLVAERPSAPVARAANKPTQEMMTT